MPETRKMLTASLLQPSPQRQHARQGRCHRFQGRCIGQRYRQFQPPRLVALDALLQALVEEQITGLAALPPIWASVFNPRLILFNRDDYDFSRLRYIMNTGAKLAVPLVRKVRETFPQARLYLMYGFWISGARIYSGLLLKE
jgi:acyl-CoA synthetase (AMP-forming)/AMP-acid ligase II